MRPDLCGARGVDGNVARALQERTGQAVARIVRGAPYASIES